ncbi:PilN domain-containing protein [Gilvimarinus chinensis]|uniref:PilN domain-containing protein n=1 Tax=Gilvimarinus chinensis TaxID=396005 RepID=UPI0003777AEE|nr:PilN domain-containing protein [Gilvimarinus chinensis]
MSSNNQWQLFGFDLRQIGAFFIEVWQEIFWSFHSPVRKVLDRPVRVFSEQTESLDEHNPKETAAALMLPEHQFLSRCLVLPRAALASLNQIIEAEVAASSPFVPEDTVKAYRVDHLDGRTIKLRLAIANKFAIAELLHRKSASSENFEIWAPVQGEPLVFEGFAESKRNSFYKKRLVKTALLSFVCLLALIFVCSLPWVYQSFRLAQLEDSLSQGRQEARTAIQMRATLSENNDRLSFLQARANESARPLLPLTVLTDQLDDDAWLSGYEQESGVLEIDGYAQNAAALIQKLTESANFFGVKPTSAIRQVGNNSVDRFRLELQLPTHREGGEKVD